MLMDKKLVDLTAGEFLTTMCLAARIVPIGGGALDNAPVGTIVDGAYRSGRLLAAALVEKLSEDEKQQSDGKSAV